MHANFDPYDPDDLWGNRFTLVIEILTVAALIYLASWVGTTLLRWW